VPRSRAGNSSPSVRRSGDVTMKEHLDDVDDLDDAGIVAS
jgi:hypothetical protein